MRKIIPQPFGVSKKSVFLPRQNKGLVAEWLGTGLQNRALQFESGRDLQNVGMRKLHSYIFYILLPLV